MTATGSPTVAPSTTVAAAADPAASPLRRDSTSISLLDFVIAPSCGCARSEATCPGSGPFRSENPSHGILVRPLAVCGNVAGQRPIPLPESVSRHPRQAARGLRQPVRAAAHSAPRIRLTASSGRPRSAATCQGSGPIPRPCARVQRETRSTSAGERSRSNRGMCFFMAGSSALSR
jgi:hypothetical protein